MQNNLVSIIIPVHNGVKTLKKCLDSIFFQTYKNYEVIVVDNNSTDNTAGIIKQYNKIKYIFEPQQSRGVARNTGEKQAKGKIILMTDSDCIVPADWIEKMIKPIVQNNYEAVQGLETSLNNDYWSRQQQIRNKNKKHNSLIGNIDTKNFAIKKQLLEKIGHTSRKYHFLIDTELSIRLQKNNNKIFFSSVKVGHHHPNTILKIIKRHFWRGYWCAVITYDYEDYLANTDFKKNTEQTFWAFIKIFPGLIRTTVFKGIKYAYFDAVTGLAWRFGLLSGKLHYKYRQINFLFFSFSNIFL